MLRQKLAHVVDLGGGIDAPKRSAVDVPVWMHADRVVLEPVQVGGVEVLVHRLAPAQFAPAARAVRGGHLEIRVGALGALVERELRLAVLHAAVRGAMDDWRRLLLVRERHDRA